MRRGQRRKKQAGRRLYGRRPALLFLLVFGLMLSAGCGRDIEPAAPPPTTPTPAVAAALPAPQVATLARPTDVPPPATATVAEPTATVEPSPTPEPPATPAPLPTPVGVTWVLKVPILMYHYVSVPPADADIYRTDLSVPPDLFREQMAYLADNGYTPIDLYDLSLAITGQITLPDKPVILTFDDGYIDNYENAFPVLKEYGFTGTFFIITEFIDFGREGYMTWPMIEEMAAAGMRIESHTKTHPDLTTLGRDGVIYELLGSQQTIAAHIGYTPRYLCYPAGSYNELSMQIADELGLWGAVTTQGGSWHSYAGRFEWSRVRVRNTSTLDVFPNLVFLEGTTGGKQP